MGIDLWLVFRSDFAISFVIASERLYGYFWIIHDFWRDPIVYRSLFGREGKYSQERFLAAVNQGFSWQGLLAGLLVAAAGNWLFTAPALVTLGLIIAGLSGLLIVIVPIIKGKSKVGGFFMGIYDLYGVTSYIGDFVSYSRLMALGSLAAVSPLPLIY